MLVLFLAPGIFCDLGGMGSFGTLLLHTGLATGIWRTLKESKYSIKIYQKIPYHLSFNVEKLCLCCATWRAGAENVFPFCPTTERGIIPTIPCKTGCTGDAIIMAEPRKYQSVKIVLKLKILQ